MRVLTIAPRDNLRNLADTFAADVALKLIIQRESFEEIEFRPWVGSRKSSSEKEIVTAMVTCASPTIPSRALRRSRRSTFTRLVRALDLARYPVKSGVSGYAL